MKLVLGRVLIHVHSGIMEQVGSSSAILCMSVCEENMTISEP